MLDVAVAVAEIVVVGVVVTTVEAGVSRQVQTELMKAPADFRKALSWLDHASAAWRLSTPQGVNMARLAAARVTVVITVVVTTV